MYVCMYVSMYVYRYTYMMVISHCRLNPLFLNVLYFYICSIYRKTTYIFLQIK